MFRIRWMHRGCIDTHTLCVSVCAVAVHSQLSVCSMIIWTERAFFILFVLFLVSMQSVSHSSILPLIFLTLFFACVYVCVCSNQRHCSCSSPFCSSPSVAPLTVSVSIISHVIPPNCSVQKTQVQRNICKLLECVCVSLLKALCVSPFTSIDSILLPDTGLKHLCKGLRLHCVLTLSSLCFCCGVY